MKYPTRRPPTAICANCGEIISLVSVTWDGPQRKDGFGNTRITERIYTHDSTGSIDTEHCLRAIRREQP